VSTSQPHLAVSLTIRVLIYSTHLGDPAASRNLDEAVPSRHICPASVIGLAATFTLVNPLKCNGNRDPHVFVERSIVGGATGRQSYPQCHCHYRRASRGTFGLGYSLIRKFGEVHDFIFAQGPPTFHGDITPITSESSDLWTAKLRQMRENVSPYVLGSFSCGLGRSMIESANHRMSIRVGHIFSLFDRDIMSLPEYNSRTSP